ncbi:protein arginine N-methyltransferase 1-like [Drosophila innubila]|uniref:protein arginine N-methyltransferase 1-like n=1 Tax=Drosophila innubila TaxID=198719 RepID=UPI00148E70EE|nr:protein arginine N-methyltransferase 1-like [Drosophila innubila]
MESCLTGNTEAKGRDEDQEDQEISPDIYAQFLQRHEGVMRDEATMLGFKAAFAANAELFRGATVLEVNCGSGMLSMWAAQRGAARVIAVEPSDVCRVARQLVRHNHLEHVIDVVQGTVQQLQLPPVDVIISKWMGACLMYSSAVEDVLCARDKCLKPGGCIFPSQANLYIAAADQARRSEDMISSPLQYWTRYSGLNLSLAFEIAQQTPLVSYIDVTQVLTQRHLLQRFDMHTLSRDQLSFTVPFKLRSLRQSLAKYFVLYFDFRFPSPGQVFKVSTSPSAPATQWKQTLFPIDDHLPLCVGDTISGQFRVSRSPRHLDFDIGWSCHNKLTSIKLHTQIYRMQGEAQAI